MNNSYRDKALAVLRNTDASFVYVTEEAVLTSEYKGIRRLLALVNEQTTLAEGLCGRPDRRQSGGSFDGSARR